MSDTSQAPCDGHAYTPEDCHGPVAEYVVTQSDVVRNDIYAEDAPLPQRTFRYCSGAVEDDRQQGWHVEPLKARTP